MSGYSLPDLLARVETATGAISLGFTKDGDDDLLIVGGLLGCTNGRDYCTVVDAFRGSLDAALALCERMLPGWELELTSEHRDHAVIWRVMLGDPRRGMDGEATTPALALLASMLKALVAQQ